MAALGGNAAAWAATTLQKIRKNIKSSIEQDSTLMTRIQKMPKEAVSNDQDVRIPLKVTFPGKYGAMDLDGGVFGDGGGSETIQGTVRTVVRRHALALNLQPIFNTANGEKAIASALVKQTADGLPEFLAMLEREANGNGDLVLGTVSSIAGAPTLVLTNTDFGSQRVRKGQDVNVYLVSNPYTLRNASPINITKTSIFENKVTVSDATNIANTDVICVVGQVYDSTVKGILGIPLGSSLATSGTYLGIDKANVAECRTPGYDSGGAALSLYALRIAGNRLRTKRGVDALKSAKIVLYTHPCQTAQYEDQIMSWTQANRQAGGAAPDNVLPYGKNDAPKVIEGWECLESINAPKNRMDGLELADWFCPETVPLDFYDFPDTGKPVRVQVDGTTGTPKARLLWYLLWQGNLANSNPGNGFTLPNLLIPTGY